MPSPLRRAALLVLVALPVAFAHGQGKKPLTFDQIFKNGEPRLLSTLPNITGWADEESYIEVKKNEGDDRAKSYAVNVRTGAERLYRDLAQYKELLPQGVDPARPAATSESATRLVYVKENDLYLLDTERRTFTQITATAAEEKNPTFSPDGNHVAFTRENDLYSVALNGGREIRYTRDGSELVSNGWASWVYYEEILGRQTRYRAFWWSPDSRRILFYRFDDSNVPMFPLYASGGKHGTLEKTRYPKVDDPNPEVRIGFATVGDSAGVVWGEFDEKRDQYFGPPFWVPGGKEAFVQWMNRGQDSLVIFGVEAETGKKRVVYRETQQAWVEFFESVTFLNVRPGFILQSDRDGWSHLYAYDMNGAARARLTQGPWSVVSLLGVNEENATAYFTAKKESSTRTDLYRVGLDGRNLARLSAGPFTHQVTLGPKGSYFLTRYSNTDTPSRMAIYDGKGKLVKPLADSKTRAFDEYAIAPTRLIRVRTADGYDLPVSITMPAAFDSTRKYPVLISVYGGPLSGSVSDGWKGLSSQWWAMEGIIQVSIDHRGSGHFGKAGAALMHRKLGTWEMNDYMEVARWLRAKPYVDTARVCITGGSYGGYVACMALSYGAEVFTHGIAHFSVTDWQLYDSHYTERYMDGKKENPDGYEAASVMTHAGTYRGLLRIVHGTMDDNVHMQNSLQLIDRLQELGKHFEFMLYPGGRHGWGGAKGQHDRNETYRFHYRHLLGKEFPEEQFKSARPGRPF
jgi:dipeptidyl-peptidase-4